MYIKSFNSSLLVEASHLLDLQRLIGENPPNVLVPENKKNQSIFTRSSERFTFPYMIIVSLFSLYLGVRDGFEEYEYIILALIIIVFYIQQNRIKGIYWISEDGLIIPYTWLTIKKLPFTQIVSVSFEKLVEKDTGSEYDGLRIIIDNPSLKFNFSGMQDPSIVLSSNDYDKSDLEIFSEELIKLKKNSSGSTNTHAQRLTDQINNSWFGRWKLVFLNTIDSTSEFAYYLILGYLILDVFLGNTLTIPIIVILSLYFISVLAFNIADIPSSIFGIRSHELGALIYNEADLITTVRFMLMSQPNVVNLLNCELLFEGEPIAQINELKELHPQEIEPGKLTYCVAQFLGNHTKSIGLTVKFKYSEDETDFELPIYWA